MNEEPAGTLVLGIGNVVHSDDGVGIHAIDRLRRHEHLPPGVKLVDGGTHGLGLISHISGFQRLLVIDAIDAGQEPGSLIRLEGAGLEKLPGKPSVHQLGLADLMIAMQLLGERPAEVVVIGVQPQSTDWSVELTEPVRASLGALLETVIAQLESWAALPSAV
jgi:hydrogenase maturation protease